MSFQYRSMLSVLIEAGRGCCGLCGGALNRSKQAMRRRAHDCPTIDHVMPRALGGHDGPGNILAAHEGCNTRKAHRYPTDTEIAALERINAVMGWPTLLKRNAA